MPVELMIMAMYFRRFGNGN